LKSLAFVAIFLGLTAEIELRFQILPLGVVRLVEEIRMGCPDHAMITINNGVENKRKH